MFKLTLSVSKAQPKTKTEGLSMTDFTVKDFDIEATSDLRDLFTTRIYSTNSWKDGKCKTANYMGMFGLTMDVDKDVTIEQAKEMFKDYNYIIHTSTSHKADLPKKGGIHDRFRVILPADPAIHSKYNDKDKAFALYTALIKKFPFVDAVCAEPARKYFPYLNSAYPQLFECYINDTGVYFSISDEEVAAATVAKKKAIAAKATTFHSADIVEPDREYIHLEDEVVLSDKVTKVKIKDLKVKTPVFCPFCDDINSGSISGFFDFGRRDGMPMLYCSHCASEHKTNGNPQNGIYTLPLNEQFNTVFYIENKIYTVDQKANNITLGLVPDPFFYNLSNDTQKSLKHWLSKNRYFTSESFSVERKVNGYGEALDWKLDNGRGILDINIPPIAPVIADNDFINNWLLEIFTPAYVQFIKEWLAMYCYTNFRQLPILIINGPRGCGKSTFAEFVAALFEGVSQDWKGEKETFTAFNEKRLLILDEANVDKKEQYTLFKSITGQAKLSVNKKYKAPYQVKNNLCLILLTNEPNPMFLVEAEKPATDEDNQFFMYFMDRNRTGLNSNIKNMLRERAGHYVRTELRELAQQLFDSGRMDSCRYTIPTPRTQLMIDQFNNAKTSLEYECQVMAKLLQDGLTVKDRIGTVMRQIGPFDLVTYAELQDLVNEGKFKHNNAKSFKERLVVMKLLDRRVMTKNGEDAWQVNHDAIRLLKSKMG